LAASVDLGERVELYYPSVTTDDAITRVIPAIKVPPTSYMVDYGTRAGTHIICVMDNAANPIPDWSPFRY